MFSNYRRFVINILILLLLSLNIGCSSNNLATSSSSLNQVDKPTTSQDLTQGTPSDSITLNSKDSSNTTQQDNKIASLTDESGTIIATSDGNTVKFDKSASAIKPQAPPISGSGNADSNTVYITTSGTKYHADGCRYLSKSKIPISLIDAVNKNYGTCSVCNPPSINSDTSDSVSNSNDNVSMPSNSVSSSKETEEVTIYITKTGEKYHTSGCSYLKKSKISFSLIDAKSQGYTPCSRCNPPR